MLGKEVSMSCKCKQSDLEKFINLNKGGIRTNFATDIINEKEGWGAQMEWTIGWRGGRMFDATVYIKVATDPDKAANLPVERQKIEECIVRYIYKKSAEFGLDSSRILREFEYATDDEDEKDNTLLYAWLKVGVGLSETEVL